MRTSFDPSGPPPPESMDPDYGRRAENLGTTRRRGAADTDPTKGRAPRAAERSRNLDGGSSAAAATTPARTSRNNSCDWDTILIIVLAIVLFSFLILDIYAQIVRACGLRLCPLAGAHRCMGHSTADAVRLSARAENARSQRGWPGPRHGSRPIES
jgi:hypothetical protein